MLNLLYLGTDRNDLIKQIEKWGSFCPSLNPVIILAFGNRFYVSFDSEESKKFINFMLSLNPENI